MVVEMLWVTSEWEVVSSSGYFQHLTVLRPDFIKLFFFLGMMGDYFSLNFVIHVNIA